MTRVTTGFEALLRAWPGLLILLVVLCASVFVPIFSPYTSDAPTGVPLQPPDAAHLFGTDNLGRDVFVRTWSAGLLDIGLALAGVIAPLAVGTCVGAMVGTTRSAVVSFCWLTLIEGINAFPFLVLVIGIVAVVGPGVQGILIGLVLTNWARYARITRARALVLREADFMHATRVLGYSRLRILGRHVLPNVFDEALAYALSDFVLVIITVAGLSFLGLGVRPPTPEWGAMMSDGRLFLARAWWITVFPGLTLAVTAIGVALLAQSIIGRGEAE
jgi:peptide/nickel transport system permease protein